ncbi:MAG: hypothetical protein MSC31_08830 [Solirubrobacteraceae bacterium MAG38_C4-C5]|nr:hypothetical protein [Candidatus Siliceabacter maunaloa]
MRWQAGASPDLARSLTAALLVAPLGDPGAEIEHLLPGKWRCEPVFPRAPQDGVASLGEGDKRSASGAQTEFTRVALELLGLLVGARLDLDPHIVRLTVTYQRHREVHTPGGRELLCAHALSAPIARQAEFLGQAGRDVIVRG